MSASFEIILVEDCLETKLKTLNKWQCEYFCDRIWTHTFQLTAFPRCGGANKAKSLANQVARGEDAFGKQCTDALLKTFNIPLFRVYNSSLF